MAISSIFINFAKDMQKAIDKERLLKHILSKNTN